MDGSRSSGSAVGDEGLKTTLNPWDGRGSALGINLGDPARVLTLGRKHGLVSPDAREV